MECPAPFPDFFVAVPSYRREAVIGEKTLALLARHSIPVDNVYIFVADDAERQRYVAQLGDRWPNIVVGKPTLWRQRNFITQYFDEGSHVLSLDDDVEEIFRLRGDPLNGGVLEPLHSGGLMDIVQDAWKKMHRLGIYLWSLNVSDNSYFMNNEEHGCGVTLKNGLCNGFFWGCRIRKNPQLLLCHGDGHEDIERTVRYLDLDGAVFRYREFCAKTRCKSNAGGLQASMSVKQRQAEEKRSIQLLADEFPLLLELLPGSKLGAKFTSVLRAFRQRSVLNITQFQKCVARKKLNLLVGARCVFTCLDPTTGVFRGHYLCTIEVGRPDIGMLGLKTPDGQRFLASSWAFNDAIIQEKLFVLWLPEPACKELGVTGHGCVEDLPAFLDQDRARAVTKSSPKLEIAVSAVNAKTLDEPFAVEPLNEFARYLDSLACDDAGDEEDEDQPQPGSTTQLAEAKDCSKAARKASHRHEDPDWIATQREAEQETRATGSTAESSGEQRELNILRDWVISADFDVAMSQKVEEKTKGPSEVNDLFCSSRIWGGGWGGQCTRPRLDGDTYCLLHRSELGRQGYLTHGRIDGAIPPKKRKEFEKWQNKLRDRTENRMKSAAGSGVAQTLTDSKAFSEEGWRAMGRGAGESARAFEFRTGIREELDQRIRKRPAAAVQAAAEEQGDGKKVQEPARDKPKRKVVQQKLSFSTPVTTKRKAVQQKLGFPLKKNTS